MSYNYFILHTQSTYIYIYMCVCVQYKHNVATTDSEALHLAAGAGHAELCKVLLERLGV